MVLPEFSNLLANLLDPSPLQKPEIFSEYFGLYKFLKAFILFSLLDYNSILSGFCFSVEEKANYDDTYNLV